MVEEFVPLRQPPGSKQCLPTAIAAILQYHGRYVTIDEVSDWCKEGPSGCVIAIWVPELIDHDCIVEELNRDPEDELRSHVNDPNDPLPILVMVKTPFSPDMDHAIVILGIDNNDEEEEIVTYMDPLTGQNETMLAAEFLMYWDFAGSLAFLIRP